MVPWGDSPRAGRARSTAQPRSELAGQPGAIPTIVLISARHSGSADLAKNGNPATAGVSESLAGLCPEKTSTGTSGRCKRSWLEYRHAMGHIGVKPPVVGRDL